MWNDPKKLSSYPFMVFDLRDFTRADLEDLANFHIQVFNPQDILEISEEKYFLDDFRNCEVVLFVWTRRSLFMDRRPRVYHQNTTKNIHKLKV